MKTFKITGWRFSVTLTAYAVWKIEYFGQPVYSFRAWDMSEICSIPCGEVKVTEM